MIEVEVKLKIVFTYVKGEMCYCGCERNYRSVSVLIGEGDSLD